MDKLIHIKILRYFLNNPYEEIYLRELAKHLKLSPFSAKKYVDLLLKEELITEERKANLRYLKANHSSLFYKYLKISFNIKDIIKSNIIETIKENIAGLSSIVLFGGIARGEDDNNSDIDIVVIGKEKEKFSLSSKLNKKISREVNLHIFSWSDWNKQAEKNKAFYSDIISHGLPLYGEMPLVK